MNKIKEKITAIILTCVIIITTSYCYIEVKANDNINSSMLADTGVNTEEIVVMLEDEDVNVTNSLVEEVEEDVEDLNAYGLIQNNNLTNINVDNSNNITYGLQFGETYNEVEIVKNNDKTMVLECIQPEEGLKDVVEFKSDGKIYLDGKEVEYEIDSGDDENVINGSGYATSKTYASCKYGKASDYTKKGGTKKVASINFKKKIKEITASAVIGVLTTILFANPWAGLASSTVANGILSWITREKSTTKHLSLKATYYYYKNNTGKGFVPKWNKTIYQVRGTYYEKENYKGSSYKKTMYQVISYD